MRRYAIRAPQVAHQIMDGEVVIIDFDSGSYFSLEKTGAEIWGWLGAGASRDEIEEILGRRHPAERDLVGLALDRFIGRLAEEGLIIPREDESRTAVTALGSAPDPPGGPGVASFESPTLQKFTDMQEMLLLDPIHDVQEDGWPGRKTGPS